MEEINTIIAKNLKKFRERKKLSLEKVSELTGVSKTMIGQIERGDSSPTITTIWKIANGLKISFSSLLQHPKPQAVILKKEAIQLVTEDNGKFRAYSYYPYQEEKRFELYKVEIDVGGNVHSDPHLEGTEEYILVFEGELTISVDQLEYTVYAGDSIMFKADKPHSYHNSGTRMTKLSMTLFYPK